MQVNDFNGNKIIKPKNKSRFYEKCIFCDKLYCSKIDKYFDICSKCEELSLE